MPVHGAGLQAHFDAAGTGLRRTPTPHSVRRQVRRLGELGLSVNISEMDVRVAGVSERKLFSRLGIFFLRYKQVYQFVLLSSCILLRS